MLALSHGPHGHGINLSVNHRPLGKSTLGYQITVNLFGHDRLLGGEGGLSNTSSDLWVTAPGCITQLHVEPWLCSHLNIKPQPPRNSPKGRTIARTETRFRGLWLPWYRKIKPPVKPRATRDTTILDSKQSRNGRHSIIHSCLE